MSRSNIPQLSDTFCFFFSTGHAAQNLKSETQESMLIYKHFNTDNTDYAAINICLFEKEVLILEALAEEKKHFFYSLVFMEGFCADKYHENQYSYLVINKSHYYCIAWPLRDIFAQPGIDLGALHSVWGPTLVT